MDEKTLHVELTICLYEKQEREMYLACRVCAKSSSYITQTVIKHLRIYLQTKIYEIRRGKTTPIILP